MQSVLGRLQELRQNDNREIETITFLGCRFIVRRWRGCVSCAHTAVGRRVRIDEPWSGCAPNLVPKQESAEVKSISSAMVVLSGAICMAAGSFSNRSNSQEFVVVAGTVLSFFGLLVWLATTLGRPDPETNP